MMNSDQPFRITRKMEEFVDLCLAGDPNDPETGPLDVYTAGKLCGWQKKRVRELFETPEFDAFFKEKERLFLRDKHLTTFLLSPAHLRDLLRWQKERAGLREEIERLKIQRDEAYGELRAARAKADA